ncbi:MAG: hypothetical protein H6Q36_1180, partial [Chloroflexi bacterium]|nr:hypothetical protein [Chloroflexota bacterium]
MSRPRASLDGRPDAPPEDGTRPSPNALPAALPNGRPGPHPANDLNELSGEEWLFFTRSVLLTAYPSELGHPLRRRHGANKPPRLMARLVEFFSRTGELVLDPFAGVGGTLLGAAIARGPRRALGFELDPRWVSIYEQVVADALSERGGDGPELADLGPADPGGRRGFDPSGCEMRTGDALELLAGVPDDSIDFVATDPPYTVQIPLTMAGGKLAEAHANRRTGYAMVGDDPRDLANAPSHDAYLAAMESVFIEFRRVPPPPGSCPRATSSGTRRARDCGPTATRGPSCPTLPTSTWSCCGARRRPEGDGAADHRSGGGGPGGALAGRQIGCGRASVAGAGGQVGEEDVRVDVRVGRRGRVPVADE